ncbi:MAG: hypothetical protein AAFY36_04020 [Bacteroidota bacterium]
MDSKQAGQMIERLLAIHKSLQMEQNRGISTLERDTVLDYLRKLYDYYHEQQPSKGKTPTKTATSAPIAQPAAKVVSPQKPSAAPPPPAAAAPKAAPKPTPPPAAPAPKPAPKPVVTPPPAPANIPSRASGPVPAKVKALFADQGSNELSDKLSRTPIADLTKALSIVDRALYANELFDGNQELMNNFLADCNRYSSFDQAQGALGELAINNNWTEASRSETAKNFIKLVRRRYA